MSTATCRRSRAAVWAAMTAASGALGEALELAVGEALQQPGGEPPVALLGGLAGDPKGLPDLRPGAPAGAGCLDKVVEQLIGQLLDLLLIVAAASMRCRGSSPPSLDGGDQLLEIHASSLA